MQNIISNMFDHYTVIVSSWQESAEELIFYRMQSTANDHANFICTYLSCILSRLTDLWSLSTSIAYNDKDIFSLRDLIRYMLPNYDDVILSTVRTREQAGELFFQSGKERVEESFAPLIIDNPIMLNPDEQLFSAAIIMAVKQIHTLPIVHRAHLLGTISRGELCLAILQQDLDSEKKKN